MKKYLIVLQQKIIKNIFFIVGGTLAVVSFLPTVSVGQFSTTES
ncbi:MAG: hypothetical protein WCP92_03660 [bacterium]